MGLFLFTFQFLAFRNQIFELVGNSLKLKRGGGRKEEECAHISLARSWAFKVMPHENHPRANSFWGTETSPCPTLLPARKLKVKHKKLDGDFTQNASPTSWANSKCSSQISAASPSSPIPNQPHPTALGACRGWNCSLRHQIRTAEAGSG